MKYTFTLLLMVVASWTVLAQSAAKFTAIVSTDSVLMNNQIKVTFQLEEANGTDFQMPTLDGFMVVAGPMTSSRTTIINGERSQSVSYTYYLAPEDVGTYYIDPASIAVEGEILTTDPVQIDVYPNPDGIQQEIPERSDSLFDSWWSQDPFPKKKSTPTKKKKRLTKRI